MSFGGGKSVRSWPGKEGATGDLAGLWERRMGCVKAIRLGRSSDRKEELLLILRKGAERDNG